MKPYHELKTILKTTLSGPRFAHCVNVGKLAEKLGRRHGWNPERAKITGFLHDCAKEWSPKKLRAYVQKYKVKVPDPDWIWKVSPNMFHAYVGADVARRNKWVRPKEADAIATHTFAASKMTLAQKIIFISDFAAHGRQYDSAKHVRKMAMKDLDGAFREALAMKIYWQLKKSKPIHPTPVLAWNKVACRMK